jgi:hypothetical protein
MAAGRHSSYLGKVRLLLLLLVLGTPCVVAQESKSKLRTWTSSIGTKIEAELVSRTGEQVTLKTKAGKTLKVPLNKLSKADQEFAAAQSSPQEPAKGEQWSAPKRHSWFFYQTKGEEVVITECRKASAPPELVIPTTIESKSVTKIGDLAFYNFYGLTNITIPDSVTSIGHYSFSGCDELTSITIPDSVTNIGRGAFRSTRLTRITIPDSVTSIEDATFRYCDRLTSITIPDSVTSIGFVSFGGCHSLTSITIPDSVTSIGRAAFVSCDHLTAVTFLGDAPKAGEQVFKEATPTIYRKPEAKGWGETFAGRPVKLISEKP